jgi:hypothetical protein
VVVEPENVLDSFSGSLEPLAAYAAHIFGNVAYLLLITAQVVNGSVHVGETLRLPADQFAADLADVWRSFPPRPVRSRSWLLARHSLLGSTG